MKMFDSLRKILFATTLALSTIACQPTPQAVIELDRPKPTATSTKTPTVVPSATPTTAPPTPAPRSSDVPMTGRQAINAISYGQNSCATHSLLLTDFKRYPNSSRAGWDIVEASFTNLSVANPYIPNVRACSTPDGNSYRFGRQFAIILRWQGGGEAALRGAPVNVAPVLIDAFQTVRIDGKAEIPSVAANLSMVDPYANVSRGGERFISFNPTPQDIVPVWVRDILSPRIVDSNFFQRHRPDATVNVELKGTSYSGNANYIEVNVRNTSTSKDIDLSGQYFRPIFGLDAHGNKVEQYSNRQVGIFTDKTLPPGYSTTGKVNAPASNKNVAYVVGDLNLFGIDKVVWDVIEVGRK